MGIFNKFRRNKTSKASPAQEEINNANLNPEGDATAKLSPVKASSAHAHPHPNFDEEQTPKWSNYHKDHDKNGNNNGNINDDDYNLMVDDKPVYIVKQSRGYLSILFSTAQTLILIAMMIQCGLAPISINRKFKLSSKL